MYYLIWLCAYCSINGPANLGLYGNLNACESAKKQVYTLRKTQNDLGFMTCVRRADK